MSSPKRPHGNRKDNPNPHLLYAIYDHVRREIYKFGITEDDGGDDPLPSRVRTQLFSWNRLVGFARFTARVLKRMLPGSKVVYEEEDDAVDEFIAKRNRPPVGNDPHPYHSRK